MCHLFHYSLILLTLFLADLHFCSSGNRNTISYVIVKEKDGHNKELFKYYVSMVSIILDPTPPGSVLSAYLTLHCVSILSETPPLPSVSSGSISTQNSEPPAHQNALT